MQRPPAYSAIKVDGERAYDRARGGEEVTLDERPISVHRLAIVAMPDADHTVLEAECGKGTYVRSLARDSRPPPSAASVMSPRSAAWSSVPFDDATMLAAGYADHRARGGHRRVARRYLVPIGFVLGDLPEVAVQASDAARIGRGQSVLIRGRGRPGFRGGGARHIRRPQHRGRRDRRGRLPPETGIPRLKRKSRQ